MDISIKSICVFCGSSEGTNPEYRKQAAILGRALAEHAIKIVYGGASIGLMGALADAANANKGKVTGVIPESLEKKEVAHKNLYKLIVTRSMHERKATMATLSDAYIVLPGGYGTLEELFEIITWSQLGIHQKPIIIVNLDGYYDKMLSFLETVEDSGFIHTNGDESGLFTVVGTIEDCMDKVLSYAIEETETFKRTMI